jgi:hypothetical protein
MKEQRLLCLTVRQKGALIRFEQEFRNSRVAVATPVVTYVYYSDSLQQRLVDTPLQVHFFCPLLMP